MKKIAIVFISVLSFFCLLRTDSDACEVVAVRSFDSLPYRQALKGFETTSQCSLTVLDAQAGKAEIMREIRSKSPDAVVAVGSDALKSVLTVRDIPVFFTMVVVTEFKLPADSGNFFGVGMEPHVEVHAKTLAELLPKGATVGIIYDPEHLNDFVSEATRLLNIRGIKAVAKEVNNSKLVVPTIESLKNNIDALWLPPDSTIINEETVKAALSFSFQNRIPIFAFSRKYVEKGAFASLQVEPYDMGSQLGGIAQKVLRGKSVAPRVAFPEKYVLVFNRKIAKKFGIGPNIVQKAEIIK